MVQRMGAKPRWEKAWFSLQRRDYVLPKLLVFLILVGLAFKMLYGDSSGFADGEANPLLNQTLNLNPLVNGDLSDNGQSTAVNTSQASTDFDENANRTTVNGSVPEVSGDSPENLTQIAVDTPPVAVNLTDQMPNKETCDIFKGDWIPNPSGPLYTYETCPLITAHQNCIKNGRPDTGFLYWKWRPKDCELPPFDARKFLELMRNKTWALIGDSLSRNHVESLLCILSQVDPAIESYHDKEWRSRRWQFASYNFTISVIWSPFLAKALIFEDYNGVSSAPIQLHLDKLDQSWIDLYPSLDYMIFSSGEWFSKSAIYYENDTILGGHNLQKNYTDIGFDLAYRKILQILFNFILESDHKGTIFYRTTTTDHFENGEWYNGGSCQRTKPVKEGELDITELTKILRAVEVDEFEKAERKGYEKGMNLKLLDVMSQSSLRPDGHPGLYRYDHPLSMGNDTKIYYDCLHWCLPGPIDSWNDLIMEMVVNG